jgi:hypothetical protein
LFRASANWQAALSNTLPMMQRKWVSWEFPDVTATTICTLSFENLSHALAVNRYQCPQILFETSPVGGDDQVIPKLIGLKRFDQPRFSWRRVSVTYTPSDQARNLSYHRLFEVLLRARRLCRMSWEMSVVLCMIEALRNQEYAHRQAVIINHHEAQLSSASGIVLVIALIRSDIRD